MNACAPHLSCVARCSPSFFSAALANSLQISYSFSFSSRTVVAHTLRRALLETPTSSRQTPQLDIAHTTTYLRMSIYAGWLSASAAMLPRLAFRGLLRDSPTPPSGKISQSIESHLLASLHSVFVNKLYLSGLSFWHFLQTKHLKTFRS